MPKRRHRKPKRIRIDLNDPKPYSINELARIADRHPRVVQRWITEGRLKARRADVWPYEWRLSPEEALKVYTIPARRRRKTPVTP